jgi:hypothetical protein
MRYERTLGSAISVEQNPRFQCHHVLTLDGRPYRCVRPFGHGGCHDSNCLHPPDGGLVRW